MIIIQNRSFSPIIVGGKVVLWPKWMLELDETKEQELITKLTKQRYVDYMQVNSNEKVENNDLQNEEENNKKRKKKGKKKL